MRLTIMKKQYIKRRIPLLVIFTIILFQPSRADNILVWQIGENDNNPSEFALAPDGYEQFILNDFGWEDKYFLIGYSDPKTEWPYIIPGTSDTWGGTWGTSGWRSSTLNILFGLNKLPESGQWKLIIDILDCNSDDLPLFKVTINGKSWKYRIPAFNKNEDISRLPDDSEEYLIEIQIPKGLIKKGGNEINLTTLEGSWLKFDNIRLEGPEEVELTESKKLYLRSIKLADYEIQTENGTSQPLLVDIQHLSGTPELIVLLNGEKIFSETVEKGRYTFEAPMPAVTSALNSEYEIRVDGIKIESGVIERQPQKIISLAGYVNTKMGTAHSRWMIAPGPWMPFSMVPPHTGELLSAWTGSSCF